MEDFLDTREEECWEWGTLHPRQEREESVAVLKQRGKVQAVTRREEGFRLLHLERKGSGYYTYRGKVQVATLREERLRV